MKKPSSTRLAPARLPRHILLIATLFMPAGLKASAPAAPTTEPVCHDSARQANEPNAIKDAMSLSDANAAMTRGEQAFRQGNFEQAAMEWRNSLAGFRAANDFGAQCQAAQAVSAAYQAMGNYRLALDVLCPA